MKPYLIQRGDTLSVLARKFGTSIREILAVNPRITNPDLIFTGTFLNLPEAPPAAAKAPVAAPVAAAALAPVTAPEPKFDLKLLDDTEYDDSKTIYYINSALLLMDGLKSPAPANIVERNYLAWIYLRAVRRLGEPNGPNEQAAFDKYGITPPRLEGAPSSMCLADAEHYMYMRFLVSNTGDSAASALPYGYQARKLIGDRQKLRTDPKFPVLPASYHGLIWGLVGYNEGMKDYQKAHAGATGDFGSSWEGNKDLISGAYKKL